MVAFIVGNINVPRIGETVPPVLLLYPVYISLIERQHRIMLVQMNWGLACIIILNSYFFFYFIAITISQIIPKSVVYLRLFVAFILVNMDKSIIPKHMIVKYIKPAMICQSSEFIMTIFCVSDGLITINPGLIPGPF